MNHKQRREELKRYIESISDGEGHAVVDVSLGEEEELFDPLSMKGQKDLDGRIYDYIEAQTNVIPAEVPLRIRLHGDFGDMNFEGYEVKPSGEVLRNTYAAYLDFERCRDVPENKKFFYRSPPI